MDNVIQLWPNGCPRQISTIPSRDEVLSILVPKMLGLLWEAGEPEKFCSASNYRRVNAVINNEPGHRVWAGALVFGSENFALDAYAPTVRSPITKVFSAHIGAHATPFGPPFKYWNGRCGILSWKRGLWEDRIANAPAAPRTLAHVLTAGLIRTRLRNPPEHE